MADETPKPNLPQVMPAGGQVVAVVPQSVEEIFRVAKGVVQSGLAPYALTGKTDTAEQMSKATSAVAIVIMAGAELGLPPMVALRSFTAINGRPALYGDGLINVVRRSGRAKKLRVEYTSGTDFRLFIRAGKLREPYGNTPEELAADLDTIRAEFMAWPIEQRTGGYCDAERADGGETKCVIFTVAQAMRAGLWDDKPLKRGQVWKDGQKVWINDAPNDSPWYRYPERMLGWRAAGFCLRELFGDVLGGITDDWEAREISGMVDVTPTRGAERSGPPSPPPPPPEDQTEVVHVEGQQNQAVTGTVEESGAETTKVVQSDTDDFNNDDSGVTTLPDPTLNIDAYLVRLDEELAFCVSPGDVEEGYAGILEGVDLDPAARKRAEAVRDQHLARVNK